MTGDRQEKLINSLLRRALVPKGFRPGNQTDEEAMLQALGHVEIEPDHQARMLEKIRGQRPFDCEQTPEPIVNGEIEVNQELAAMFKNEGEDLPPEIADRLKELESEASQEPDDDPDDDGRNHEP